MGDRDHSIECETCGVYFGGFNDREAEHVCQFDYAQIIAAHGDFCACESMSIPPWCATCEARRLLHRLATLAANLRMAGALELAFEMGTNWPYYVDPDSDEEDLAWSQAARAWRPGCHRTAPGWAHGEGEK